MWLVRRDPRVPADRLDLADLPGRPVLGLQALPDLQVPRVLQELPGLPELALRDPPDPPG